MGSESNHKWSKETSAGHPRIAAAQARKSEHVDEKGVPLLTPAQAREIMLMESRQERERLDRLRKENDERVRAERRFNT